MIQVQFVCHFINAILKKHNKILLIVVLARAIHSFARIGIELFLEATSAGLFLKTINSTKTSFASIFFNLDFFMTFSAKSSRDPNENQCKLALKTVLDVFRNMKQVWRVQMHCKSFEIFSNFPFAGGNV